MTEPATVPRLPLEGVRVLDLSRVLAGPWCAMVLGDLGADVVKVEHPERGDDTRDWGVRLGAGRQTTYFNSVNRNKRSVALDLQTPDGLAAALELARQSDVVIQNFKHGGATHLGVGYEQIRAINPGVVYCSITGYDPTGPEAARPGYDLAVQGESGLMAINGDAESPPVKFGVAAVDMMTGQYAAQAILAALFDRTRNGGTGRHVEMALYDSGISISAYYGLEALTQGREPQRFGNAHPSIVPYGVYHAADGPMVVAVGNNAQFQRFCREVIERPDLADDPRFQTNTQRSLGRPELLPQLKAGMLRFPRATLLARMKAAGIPCGEVHGLLEALQSERTRQSGLLVQFPHAEAGTVHVMAPPYRLDGARPPVRLPPPDLGSSPRNGFE